MDKMKEYMLHERNVDSLTAPNMRQHLSRPDTMVQRLLGGNGWGFARALLHCPTISRAVPVVATLQRPPGPVLAHR